MAATSIDIKASLPPTCDVSVPSEQENLYTFLSKRWLNLGPSTLPAAAIVPSTEDDIVAVVRFAAANGLRVLPQCGACGGVVVTSRRTLYLDMEKFRSVQVDAGARTVTFGGGALTADVQPAVTSKGFYSGWANSGFVGMVGNILGGGLGQFMGTRGYTCDYLLSARIVTASGDIVQVSYDDESDGAEKKELFHTLKGAGAGLGVVLSMTARIYPLAELNLVEGVKTPQIAAVFAREDFDAAAALWDRLSRGRPAAASVTFALLRALPVMPNAGQPIIMVRGSFTGSEEEAGKAFEPFRAPELEARGIAARPSLVDVTTANLWHDRAFTKGKSMDSFNGLIKGLSGEQVVRAARRFADFVEQHGEASGRCMTTLVQVHPETLTAVEGAAEAFMCHRDRAVIVQSLVWDVAEACKPDGEQWGRDMLDIVRTEDRAKGLADAILAGNARVEDDMSQILSPEKMEKLRRQKERWDPKGVFWNPVVDGWVVDR
ncbi:FAD-binding domain-containing protein [Xylariomycetidae sp. FL2044]|nr:FAD-binding domain-containing protein [Xylariomycetidae sp. FL2044]